jgi:hypothetical protein
MNAEDGERNSHGVLNEMHKHLRAGISITKKQ